MLPGWCQRKTSQFIFLSLLLALPSTLSAADINLIYYMETRVGQECTYTCVPPPAFPDFTVTLTKVTSGPYAGKYRLGDYYTVDPGQFSWMIFDYGTSDLMDFRLFASSAGDYDPPLSIPLIQPLNTVTPHAFEPNIYWYFQLQNNVAVPAGAFNEVLVWIILDGAIAPNSWHETLGLDRTLIPYAVTGVTYYARGIGEICDINVDANTGNIVYKYWLKKYEAGNGLPFLPLLLFY